MSALFVCTIPQRPPKETKAPVSGMRKCFGSGSAERAEVPVVISSREQRQAVNRGERGSSRRSSVRTENNTIYPPIRSNKEKACSMALSRSRKEKESACREDLLFSVAVYLCRENRTPGRSRNADRMDETQRIRRNSKAKSGMERSVTQR